MIVDKFGFNDHFSAVNIRNEILTLTVSCLRPMALPSKGLIQDQHLCICDYGWLKGCVLSPREVSVGKHRPGGTLY